MSRRHIPESPAHALRRARAIIRHMRDFAADCDAYFQGSVLDDVEGACAVQAFGLVFGLGVERFVLGIDNFVAKNAEVFGVKPSSHKPTPKRTSR